MNRLNYKKLFNPQEVETPVTGTGLDTEPRDEHVYIFDDEELVLAINVALAAERPLLVYGPPGSGKSSLAPNIGRLLGLDVHSVAITSRTEARDLLWTFDAVRRLSDAQTVGQLATYGSYCEPGVLWKSFISSKAVKLGAKRNIGSVVLLDEIDKADPDLPDGLLVPLGSLKFEGPEGQIITPKTGPPLVIVTSNRARELSRPFLRRCVTATLSAPSQDHLIKVAEARLGPQRSALYRRLAELMTDDLEQGVEGPSTAEFLDAVRACIRLNIELAGQEARSLVRAILGSENRHSVRNK